MREHRIGKWKLFHNFAHGIVFNQTQRKKKKNFQRFTKLIFATPKNLTASHFRHRFRISRDGIDFVNRTDLESLQNGLSTH